MKQNLFMKAISMLLVAVLVLSSLPMAVFANEAEIATVSGSEEITTFQSFESSLAPGITQTINSGYAADGQLINYYVTVADINRDDVGVQASYRDAQCSTLGMTKMTDQAASMNAKHNNPDDTANYIPHYAVVAGVNGDGYNTTTGKPSGAHVMNGVSGFGIVKAGNTPWFAIFADGKALCGTNNTDWDAAVQAHGEAKEAIGGFQLVRKDGTDIPFGSAASGPSSYLNDGRYPRSFVGVTADNKVVFMVADGNGAGGSAGTNYAESLEIMDEAGCTYILCLDGGGSATYISRPEGSNSIQLMNKPSDGSERTVSNGLVMYTSTPPSDVFEKALITAEHLYITPGNQTNVSAIGVSPAGTAAEIPENAVWTATLGTVENGLFVSDGTAGEAVVSILVDGETVGSTTINVVNPDRVSFVQRAMIVPFDESVDLAIKAYYGLNEVSFRWEDFNITLKDSTIGTVADGVFHAASSGTETEITVTLKANAEVTDTISLKLGKGSEVIFDFEDGTESADLNNWKVKDHEGKYPVFADATIVNKENGQVHSGDQAMAFHMELDDRVHGSEFYFAQSLTWIGDRVELQNALNLGFWIYIPEEATNTEIAVNYIYYNASGVQQRSTPDACLNDYFDDIQYSGWHYLTVPISHELAYIEDGAAVAASQGYKRNFFLKFYITNADAAGESSFMGDTTYYIDDVTIDYSEAVADREAPVFTDVKYAHEGMFDAVSLNGQTVSYNKVSFSAFVKDDMTKSNYTGLNTESAKVYIDGTEVPFKYVDGIIAVDDASIGNGKHTITFSICDNNGNYSQISKDITVKKDESAPVVNVVPHDPDLEVAFTDSVYWIDVVAKDVEKIKALEFKLDLDSMHDWELDHIVKLYGFELTHKYETVSDKDDMALTFVLTRTADVEAIGTQVIMSIPVRVWSFVSSAGGESTTPAAGWKNSDIPAVSVNVVTEKGLVTYLDDIQVSFSAEKFSVDTEAYTYYDDMIATAEGKAYWENNSYHVHATAAIDDKEATCTEDGYTGRTWCEICDSPVDWGTTVPAMGHNFQIADGVLKCTCGQVFTGTWTDGKVYVDGIVMDGWVNDSYWLDGVKLTGIQRVEGYYYDFGEDGVCVGQQKLTGLFYDETVSAWRYAKFGELLGGWVKIGDYWHLFSTTNKVAITGDYFYNTRNITYHFDETGRTEGVWQKTSQGSRYWYGEWYYTARNEFQRCFVEIDGQTYNFNIEGFMTVGIHPLYNDWASTVNNTMSVYEFDENGSLLRHITEAGTIQAHDGVYLIEEDGFVHTRNARVEEFNGDLYFVNHSGRLTIDGYKDITSANGNGLLEPGTYYFDEEGKLFSTGVREAEDGILYYYQDGKLGTRLYNSQLAEINGSIYLVKWSGKVAANEFREITATNSNGLLEPGTYFFGEDGKLFTGTDVVWNETEQLYYYCKDGKLGTRLYNNQLVEINGSIYFVKWSGKVAVNETRSITNTNSNGLLAAGSYYFGEDGKLFTGVKEDADGILYYYKNGQLGLRQYNSELVEIDGAIYLVKWSGKVARDETRKIIAIKSNGLLPEGTYYFGEDGKLFTGVMAGDDGVLYYYENGVIGARKYNSALVEINGDIYFVKWSGKVAVNETRNITSANSNGLLATGSYYFGEDGKLQA